MSSIISDLFYGSKQNILDNYLVHRHDRQNTSTLNKQELPPQDSFIQFVITPAINSIDFTALLKIQVELGNHVEEEMLQLSPEAESPAAVLTLQQIEKAELGKLTNVKITVSEGRQWRAFGFIPIETIRSTISSPSGEKTVLVQLKGKDALLNTLQCTIRTEFPSNTILNSQLMRSMQREHNSYIRSKHQISDQSSQLRPNMPRSPKQIVARRKSPSNNRSGQFSKPSPKQKHSSYAAEQTSKMERRKKSDLVGDGGVTEYVKEIKSIQLIFSKVNLIQSLNAPETQINLRAAGLDYSIGQIIEVKSFTKQGVNVQLVMRGKVVGRIHLSPLLLTLNKISGELPIYSESEQCMGTVIVKSPHHIEPPRNQAIIHQQHHPLPKEQVLNDLVVISIEKVLLVKPSDKYEDDHFEFSKMEGSKVEVVVRLNDTIHRFGEVALHRNLQGQYLEMAELRRKDGFFLRYLQETRDELVLEIEVFSAYRLIAYGKTKIHASSHFFHSFIPGQSQCPILHSGFYAKVMRLQPKSVYFQEHRTDVIFEVLQDIVQNKIVLTQITDAQIKRMMNLHHNATYVELKKLSILIQPHQDELQSFQSGSLMSIQKSKASTERLWGKLLDEFSCVKTKEGLVDEAEFTKIVEFYGEQIHGSLEEKFQQFVSNPVRTQDYINYLFFVTGHFFTIKQLSKSIQLARQIIPASIAKPKQVQPVEKEHVQELKGEGGLKADPCYYISKIIIHNAHLLNQGRAPNICLSVGRKVCYSNSNPEFNLQREVSLLTPIKVYHKSIAEDRLVEVAQFHPLRRQSHYQLDLTGKCFAKVTWGL